MDRARTGSRQTDARFAGELGVGTGHERRHLFVTHLNEIDFSFGALQRPHDSADAVARIAIDAAHTPFAEAFDEKVACGFRHASEGSMTRTAPSAGQKISENEAVALYHHPVGDGQGRCEHRPAISEGMKLAALAAGIDIRWKIVEEVIVEFPAGEDG